MATLFIYPKKPKNACKFPLSIYMRFYNKYDLLYQQPLQNLIQANLKGHFLVELIFFMHSLNKCKKSRIFITAHVLIGSVCVHVGYCEQPKNLLPVLFELRTTKSCLHVGHFRAAGVTP